MNFEEKAVTFICHGDRLISVLALPYQPVHRGVLIVVGGPQYRVGSHRQFLILARQLAAAGFAVLRFDYRGMGDSEGELRTFEDLDEDLRAATDVLFREVPAIQEIVIWGLCDAASAALMYADRDSRICGLALANPWVRTQEGYAKTMVKHYYGARLLQAEFWRKLLAGRVSVATSLRELLAYLGFGGAREAPANTAPFPQRMALSLGGFSGRVLFLISGQDLTAQEFEGMARTSPLWCDALKRARVEWRRLDDATHTFSRQAWRDDVGRWTIAWLKSW